LNEITNLGEEDAGGGGNIADSHKDLGEHSGGGGNVDDGQKENAQQRGLHGLGGQERDLLGNGGQISLRDGDGPDTGVGAIIDRETIDDGHPVEEVYQDLVEGAGVQVGLRAVGVVPDTGGGDTVVGGTSDNGHKDLSGDSAGDGGTADEEIICDGHPSEETHQDLSVGDGVRVSLLAGAGVRVHLQAGDDSDGGGQTKISRRFSWAAGVAVMMAILVGILVNIGIVRMREMEGGLQLGAVGNNGDGHLLLYCGPNGGDRHHGLQELGEHRGLHDPGDGDMQVRQQEGNHIHHRDLGDFDIVVEESFWHREHVTGSTIVMEKISQEVRHAVEESVMHKSARKEQHRFQKRNVIKIKNTHQVEMEWVNMVTTKLVEWADKVVYIAVGEAKNMVYVKQMMVQHTLKKERDTRRQIKGSKPRIAINIFGIKWAGSEIKVAGCMIMIVYTVRKAVDMVYMMQMTGRLIHQYEEYTRKVDCLMKEVFNGMQYDMEEFAVMKGDIKMIEDTYTVIVDDFKSVEVVRTVIIVKNIMNEGYVMQKEEELKMIEDTNVGDMDIFKFGKTVVIKMEYNAAERQKMLAVKEGGINMSRKVVRTAIVEVVRTAIMKVVRTAIVAVVRTAITIGEYNMVEMEKKLTVKKGDTNIDLFEDIHIENVIIVKSVKVVKKVKKVMFINMMEYNTAEMLEELIVKKGNSIMLEDTDMREMVIFQCVEVVKVQGSEKTFGASATWRQDTVLSGRLREIVESQQSSST
jgi:hypothetical protein